MGNVQVDGFSLRESSWGEGSIERCYDKKQLLMGGVVGGVGNIKIQKRLRQVGWEWLE